MTRSAAVDIRTPTPLLRSDLKLPGHTHCRDLNSDGGNPGIQGGLGVHRCAHVTEVCGNPPFRFLKWPGPGHRHSTGLTTSLVPIHHRLGATTPWSMVVAVLMIGVFKPIFLKRRGPEPMCITRRDNIGIGTQSPPRHNNLLMCEVLPLVRQSNLSVPPSSIVT